MSPAASPCGRGPSRVARGLRWRAMGLGLAACLVPAIALRAQQHESPVDLALAYEAQAELERHEAFRAAWVAARPELRERALGHVRDYRDPNSPAWGSPKHAVLTEAHYLLEGGTSESYPKLERAADLLDLRVMPGVFEARAEGKREPLTVRVAPLDFTNPSNVNRVKLFLIDPDGKVTRVRDEQVMRPALHPPGFDMYIHAPLTEPGVWTLYAEVRASNAYGHSPSVAIECLPAEELRAIESPSESDGANDALRERVLDVRQVGLRPAPGFTTAALSAAARSGDVSGLPARPWGAAVGGSTVWELAGSEAAASGWAIVLVAQARERPEARLAGLRGEAWGRAARELDAVVLSTGTPLGRDRVAVLRERLRARGVERLVVVGFGSAAPDVAAMRPWQEGAGVDGFVMTRVHRESAGAPRVLPGPVLVLETLADEDASEVLEQNGARTSWVRRRELAITAELELPGLVAAWVREELEQRGEGPR